MRCLNASLRWTGSARGAVQNTTIARTPARTVVAAIVRAPARGAVSPPNGSVARSKKSRKKCCQRAEVVDNAGP